MKTKQIEKIKIESLFFNDGPTDYIIKFVI